MKLTGLLALLLFVLIVFFAAPAASYAQTANAPAIKSETPDSNSPAILPDKPQLDRTRSAPENNERALIAAQPIIEHGGDLVLREPADQDELCYSLRTYIVARDDKKSDSTHVVRQVKCTPATKFGVKSADIRIQNPDTKPALK
jgi:hypothetical protein